MIKKILTFFLAAAILLSFASCIFENKQSETTEDETKTDLEATISLILNGSAKCDVVRSEYVKNDSVTVKAAIKIVEALNEIAVNDFATIKTDYKKPDEEYDSESIEILVGNTNYDESKKVIEPIGYGEFIIQAEGNKIVISGKMDASISYAADQFINKIKEIANGESKTLEYNRSDVLKGVCNTIINQIPVFENGTFNAIFDCGNSATMAHIQNCSIESVNNYTEKLEKTGYAFYNKNILGENVYYSYTTNDNQLNIFYTPFDKNVRIIIQPLSETALTGKKDEETFTKVNESTITMIGLDHKPTTNPDEATNQNGISIIIRLEDNSFIVYDGGFNRLQDSTLIFSTLKEHTGSAKPVIAAWIFSHAHTDHMGGFVNFSKNFASQVTVERFILNRPSLAAGSATSSGGTYARSTIEEALNKFPGADVIKAFPGQVFYIRNAKIEMLYTFELFAPRELTYFNTSSLVLSVEISDYKMLLTGDVSEDGSAILSRLYGDYLKSDLMTVAHHGYQGGTTELHSFIKPVHVLWPMGANHYERYQYAERSEYFFAPNTTVEKIFVARGDIYILPIPYTGNGEIKK